VAVGSGGVWKTTNAGVTFTPVFDDAAVVFDRRVTIDPARPEIVWVGTGENVSGRHVDGVTACTAAVTAAVPGSAWASNSQHIGRILSIRATATSCWLLPRGRSGPQAASAACIARPTAARPGRRCSRSTKTPASPTSSSTRRNPDVVYAAAYQRRRHVWGFLAGGAGLGHLEVHRQRRDLAAAERPGFRRATWARSAWRSRPPIRRWSMPRSKRRRRSGASIAPATGRKLGAAQQYISGGTGPHYYQEIEASPTTRISCTRWTSSSRSRATAGKRSASRDRPRQAQRQPRAVDRPRRWAAHARRHRRRPLRELRRGGGLAPLPEPAGGAVLQGGAEQSRSRSTTSSAARRTRAPCTAPRAP
jgi:hypothetical protein